MAKHIPCPEPVLLQPRGGGEDGVPYHFETFLRWLLDNDVRFNDSGPAIRMSVRIDQALTAMGSSGCLTLLVDDDAGALRECATKPLVRLRDGQVASVYPISPARPLATFLDALEHPLDRAPIPDAPREQPAVNVS